ncbi:MAG: hypothetical protein QMD80_07505, partial [archaeon]|nr:hypothetical protein [archaeon]
PVPCKPAGLTWDGENLWVSAAYASGLYKVDTTGTVLASFLITPSGALPHLWGLGWRVFMGLWSRALQNTQNRSFHRRGHQPGYCIRGEDDGVCLVRGERGELFAGCRLDM